MAYFDKYGVEFSDDRKTLVKCPWDFKGDYVIPDSVTSIGNEAFAYCKSLTSITIPNSVTSIGEEAFFLCCKLTTLTIPNSVTSIGIYAFSGCEGLTSPLYNSRVFAFMPNTYSGAYAIPDGIISIAGGAFRECKGLTAVTIPNSVISIGDCAFADCSALTNINIPNGVAYIGDCILYKSNGLKNPIYHNNSLIYVPKNQTGVYSVIRGTKKIVGSAFAYCSALTSIEIPDSVTLIGNGAFEGCEGLTSINLPNSVTSIGYDAFYGCTGLTAINLPNSVTSIGGCAFYGCTGLTSVVIPNSVTSIGYSAFRDCTGLTSVTIGKSVTSIGGGAFRDCSSLTSIVWNAKNCPDFSSKESLFREYVDECGEYVFDMRAQITSFTFGNEVERIPAYLCYETNITSIKIPKSVRSIGNKAFAGCYCLESLTISNSVISIGDYAFAGCGWLREIFVPLGQEERFCAMHALKDFTEIIRDTSAKQAQKELIRKREEQEQRRMQEQQMQEILQGSILFFDTETTGVPRNYRAPVTDSNNWPRLVQLAWIMAEKNGNVLKKKSVIIKPSGFTIPSDAAAVHGITNERANREGKPLQEVLDEFATDLSLAEQVVGHNIDFDQHIVGAELYRLDMDYDLLMDKPCTCTMKSSTDFCAIPNPNTYFGGYKWPSLQELYRKLFGYEFTGAHDALTDVTATKECFFELKRKGVIQ